MIHHELCDGLDLRQCHSCARNVSRYSDTLRAAVKTRIKPMTARGSCVDWLEIPVKSTDPTNSNL